MKKANTKKLNLSRETLHLIADQGLKEVAGGTGTSACQSVGCSNNSCGVCRIK